MVVVGFTPTCKVTGHFVSSYVRQRIGNFNKMIGDIATEISLNSSLWMRMKALI